MKTSREKILALAESVRSRGQKLREDDEAKVRARNDLQFLAASVATKLQKIPSKIRKQLDINYSPKEIYERIIDVHSIQKRLKYERTLKNEIVVLAMECNSESELLKKVAKINPFQS